MSEQYIGESNPDWRASAACKDADPEVFFPRGNVGGKRYMDNVEMARVICRTCVVAADCLDWALATKADGVCGGTTEEQRAAMSRPPFDLSY